MDNKLNFPSMNAFFMEDPDNLGTWAIPVVVMDGESIKLQNIREDRLDFFRPLVAAIAKQSGTRAYFIEYDIPSLIEEIQPEDNPNVKSIMIDGTGSGPPKEIMEMIEKIGEHIAQRLMSNKEEKPDEQIVH